jgi:CubicO group peptidase (beta-lactamase class C family)
VDPGTEHGYAPITYGWLVGELIRRADGRGPGERSSNAPPGPGLDFHIGLADSEFPRVAHIARARATRRCCRAAPAADHDEPTALSTRAFTNPPSILTSTNKPEWRRMQQPAANGHGNARSLAGFYSGLLHGRLLDSALLDELTREHRRGEDRTC